ncbi:sulfopyruvate decarboxylase subunit beta [Methanobrevibacter gottschalkii]|uniref:sulfopyruvate decarboxylase n=3 Tax=Methanobacteriaceae TaxID=2159 RepID=A0A3N5B2T8_9EURY|nr:sulfopyruvate decarboxylase subunit beta [Methanobrevibacter gottschalkii DSM 11977]SEL41006.1 sulfopyruvate decarboxylase subunit beta [Methanobrevibacter gottschalkii]
MYYLKLSIGDNMARREAIENIINCIDDELVVCNIGFPSRELYDIKDRKENFYMIGSMGLASSIGLGLALAQPNRNIVVIDGDGALLMNMGSLVTIFANNPKNLTWIVIDNGAYGSTGNQDTYAQKLDLVDVARGVGFKNSYDFEDINLKEFIKSDDASFIVYHTEPGNSKAPIIDLSPVEIKNRFMDIV